jgi:hypothetical protein
LPKQAVSKNVFFVGILEFPKVVLCGCFALSNLPFDVDILAIFGCFDSSLKKKLHILLLIFSDLQVSPGILQKTCPMWKSLKCGI